MRKSSLWLLVLIVLVLQVTLLSRIEIMGVRPDATIIVLVYVALGLGSVVGSLLGFLVGLAKLGILSASVASMPLAGTLVGFLVGRYARRIVYQSYLVQMLIIFLSVLVFDTVNFMWNSPEAFGVSMLRFSLGSAVYTSVVGVATVFVLERILGLRLVT
jgi:rod shape-determining protein MreD